MPGSKKFLLTLLPLRSYKILLVCLLSIGVFACNSKSPLFEEISSSYSGITFNNTITESDSINPLDVVNIYNGGGAGIGDFNNDGLPDVYFTGNMVPCKLYLNKGNFKFEDITDKAGAQGLGRWARGVAVIDINNDGLMDIYVCNTINKDSLKRRNILYINKGLDKDGIPHFKDMAAEYGLDVHVQSTMASFFDYDNDGDLDMYLTVNEAAYSNTNPNRFGKNTRSTKTTSVRNMGRLFRNDWNPAAKHGVYHDVSEAAGITFDGYGHGATIADINLDGWKDIYVSDDFISENILYINNHDGTFTNKTKEYFKHTSFNAMGQDIADINNDGQADVIELDMSPQDNYRKKMMLGNSNYNTFQNFDNFNLQYQYVRNTLQLNQGPRLGENDSTGDPAFSEISFMSGVAQTDWSWTPLVTDFDNDSYRDIIITNGFPRDVSDHDFISYRDNAILPVPKPELIQQIPQIKIHNYAFQNKGDLTFRDASADWGLTEPTFSNGAAIADFDNNGTMDMVINNINDKALIYKNTSRVKNDSTAHYLQISFKGSQQNIQGLGAWAEIYYNQGKHQVYENNPYRGYLSTMQCLAHFGLGKTAIVDSVIIKWPNGKKQKLSQVKADQVLKVDIANAHENYSWEKPGIDQGSLFKEITTSAGISYRHKYSDLIDFNIQTTLPHKLSEYSPALAAGDVDGNGLDDIIIGGNSSFPAQLLQQQASGQFVQKDLYARNYAAGSYTDAGVLLFDANGDGKPDIYIAGGGYQYAPQSAEYADRLYINDGKGNFTLAPGVLPANYTSKLCVKAIDINGDGKLDLFVSGRVDPWHYPKPVSSIILRNDSDKDHVKFTDVTNEVAPALKNIGMVCDALFTDFDNDSHPDLILAGEWMPVTLLKNVNGKFVNITAASGIGDKTGWWNSIVAGDFRHTGRTDYIIGNVGLNTLYQASEQYPVYITAKDFDNNGSYVPIPSLFLPDQAGVLKEFPANGRDEIVERIPTLKKRFNHYGEFAKSSLDEILTPAQRQGALRLKATMLQSIFLRNDGNGKFTIMPLPKQAQVSPLDGMATDDFDGDGNLDVLISGNDYGTEVSVGRYDAFNGLLLKGDGKGGFLPLSILQSGIYIPGNARGLVKLMGASGNMLVAASQSKDALKLFQLKRKCRLIKAAPGDVSALIKFKNGAVQKEEFYYGTSFLSQSSRFLNIDSTAQSVTFFSDKGKNRTIKFN